MNCQFLLKDGQRCHACIAHRATLLVQLHRSQQATINEASQTAPSSHVNYRYTYVRIYTIWLCISNLRYQPLPRLISRLNQLHQHHRIVTKRMERMTQKIAEKAEVEGITLDDITHQDMIGLMKCDEVSKFFKSLPEDSFRQLFWNQQLKAASLKNACTMKWHPLMIRWCLSLRHRFALNI